jgi:AcrR family transcriptional regulator
VHRYFPSKDRLYAEVLLEWASELRAYRPAGADGITRLRSRLARMALACRQNPHLVGAETALRLSADPDTRGVIAQIDQAGYDDLTGELAPPLSHARAKTFADILWTLTAALYNPAAARQRPASATWQAIDAVLDLINAEIIDGAAMP